MDAAPITASSFLSFLAYLGTGLGVLAAAAVLVSLITPHREFALIRAGNASAATAFAGTLVGLALPLHAAITHSVSLLDALIWGAASVAVQLLAYLLARAALPRISQEITDNVVAGGIFAAGVSISVGLVNAAAMTP
jgi:putative membrane protein